MRFNASGNRRHCYRIRLNNGWSLRVSMWPRFLNYSEKKCSRETKENPAVQCFQGAHHLPMRRQMEMRVAVTRQSI
jgi:hypothetical protein